MEMGGKGIPSFAKGMHVLVVDHDKHSLQSIASMLQNCSFKGILLWFHKLKTTFYLLFFIPYL